MRAVATALCVLAAGCDALFGLDHLDPTRDAALTGDGPADGSGGQCLFEPRVLLQDGSGSHDPTLSIDRMELLFVRDVGAGYDIYRAIRADVGLPFDTGLIVAEINSSGDDTDPALTADSRMIVFKSDRGGNGPRAYQATRTSGVFSSPVLVPGLENMPVYGLDVSPDGLTLYIDDGANLVAASRTARDQPVVSTVDLTTDRASFPSVSPDRLELYFNGAGLVQRTRVNAAATFDAATTTVIDAGGADGDIVADGSAIVLTGGSSSDIVYLRERCP